MCVYVILRDTNQFARGIPIVSLTEVLAVKTDQHSEADVHTYTLHSRQPTSPGELRRKNFCVRSQLKNLFCKDFLGTWEGICKEGK
jgi:hypothetical protein